MILIDEPKVVEILYEARDSCGTNCEEITNDMVYFNAAVITLTVFSIIIVIISFLGCCGALHERQCMILTYVSLVLMVIIGVSTGAAISYQNNDAFEMKSGEDFIGVFSECFGIVPSPRLSQLRRRQNF